MDERSRIRATERGQAERLTIMSAHRNLALAHALSNFPIELLSQPRQDVATDITDGALETVVPLASSPSQRFTPSPAGFVEVRRRSSTTAAGNDRAEECD